ncbi:MAG TPA: efflux RND transporter permease subunit [Thermoanaerobaculaceae bacterium]|nr:efflux RND transporter permease subunit [Thermoanaerobaculaceae bacterium]HRS17496.1 efflux RND transporter permease subunit [Thermoanaerobaculaceae bacterium]
MWITEFALRKRVATLFFAVALVIAGSSAYVTLPRESAPDITIPLIIVSAVYPGASPADMETLVTRHLERELQGVEGLKKLTSISQESVSVVTVEFVSGTDIDAAMQKVRDRVDRAKVDFPRDAEDPVLQEINFSDFPIVQVNLSGAVGPAVLKQLAEDLKDRIEGLPGVLRATLVGGLDRELRVEVDPQKLRLYGLALQDVVDAVRNEHLSVPSGELKVGSQALSVRVPGEATEPREIADFVIRASGGRPVFVRDVATVGFGFADRTSYARIDGQEAVALAVQKRLGANIIDVADAVKRVVAEEGARWPAGVQATILGDQSKDIRSMVADLENNILSGLLLVVGVLMFALGLRNAVLVGLAIPFSMLLTFLTLQLTGVTLNMIVLFSLVLAVGMLVDNAIVVIENIFRHMQEGKPGLRAASEAVREVGVAVLVSTLTTVGAFFPLVFWPGVTGDFMYYLPVTVSIVLVCSLVVAFTINPVMAATLMRVPKDAVQEEGAGGEKIFGPRILAAYRRTLSWALGHRAVALAGVAALFVGVVALFAVFNHGVEFFPETQPRQIFVDVEMSPGTRLEKTDEVTREIEQRLAGLPDVKVVAAGSGAGSQSEFGGGAGGDATQARVAIDLLDLKERSQNSFLTLDEVRRRTADLPGATIDVDRPQEGPPVGLPLAIEISGNDFAMLGSIAARVRQAIADIPGLVSLDDDFDLARPEVNVRVDRVRAARLGLTTRDIGNTLRTALQGQEAATYRFGDEDADIRVRLAEGARQRLEDLEQLTVVTEGGVQVPLSAVATLERGAALPAIRHKATRRMVTVSGRVTSPDLAEPVRREAKRRLDAIPDLLPTGVTLAFAGQSEEEDEAKAFLGKAFMFAFLVVLLLIVGTFDSFATPLIIMTSVFMSMVGVLVGLVVTGQPFGIIMTGLGVISLAGIVVNNAIVLLDYGEQLWAQGLPRREVVMLTGLRRLRPVTLTAITTILGLIPLTTGIEIDFRNLSIGTGGESSQWWRGMGVAVIFGLGFATVVTLVVVPVLYDLLLQWRERQGTPRPPARSNLEGQMSKEAES